MSDLKIEWDEDHHDEVVKFLQTKMDEGIVFHILDPSSKANPSFIPIEKTGEITHRQVYVRDDTIKIVVESMKRDLPPPIGWLALSPAERDWRRVVTNLAIALGKIPEVDKAWLTIFEAAIRLTGDCDEDERHSLIMQALEQMAGYDDLFDRGLSGTSRLPDRSGD